MSDDVTSRINLVATETGFDKLIARLVRVERESQSTKDRFRGVQQGLDSLAKQGKITARELTSATKSLSGYASKLETTLGGRNYRNASTSVDSMIESQRNLGQQFSQQLQARLRNEEATNRQTNANAQLAGSTATLGASLPRLRYALYDVSTTLAITGAAMLGLGVATAGVAIKMDREFADVVRTTGTYLDSTGQATASLRDDFDDLFSVLPASWSELTEIGTLAGQLGVANENVAEFTRLVTMLGTTTDVSMEQAATAIGRLSELLNVSADEYENLGSSILATGTSSVATESAIINTSSQIASMGAFAGMTADEVIGLSATLASLGVQPELSRGTITRVFTRISTAIANGDERLEAFGRTSGMTGQEFAELWGTDATAALQAVLQGLSNLEGTDAVGVLREMGITAARDVPTILKLAQSTELLGEQLRIADEGYANGTALQEQYGVVAETVAEKLNVLKNNVQLFISALGDSTGSLGPVVELLTKMVGVATELVDNPVASWALGLTVAATALAGALLLGVAAMARFGASGAALVTARRELEIMAVEMGLFKTQADAAAVSTARLNTALLGATRGTQGLTLALRGLKIASIVGIALVGVELLFEAFSKGSESAVRFTGDIEGLNRALANDTAEVTQNGAGYITSFSRVVNESGEEVGYLTSQVDGNRVAMDGLEARVRSVNDAVEQQTLYVGDLTKEWLSNQITTGQIGSDLIDNFSDVETVLADMGVTLSDALTSALTPDPSDDLDFSAYFASLEDEMAQLEERRDQLNYSPPSSTASHEERQRYEASKDRIIDQINDLESLRQKAENTRVVMEGLYSALETAQSQGDAANAIAEALGAAEAVGLDAGEALDGVLSTFLDIQKASLGVESALASLGQGLAQGGLDWSEYTEAGRENIGNLLSVMDAIATESGGDAATAAANMQALFDTLVQGGYASASQLSFLQDTINGLAQSAGLEVVAPSGKDFSSFFNGWASGADKAASSTRKAGSAARSAAREVRTLVDYASDLAKVWDRAFDIRFSGQSTLDKITLSILEIQEASAEAARNIRDLQTEISGLQTDLGTQQYFLSIATEYGDNLRAAEIQQNILELQDELADKQSDLTKEQAANSKALTGNSKAAIDNRDTITELVSEYQDHLGALAESGASSDELARKTAELKQDFIDQATQLGFSRAELEKYARVFDDVAYAIARVPRNITVDANVDPAIQAFNEYAAALDQARSSAARGIPNVTGGGFGNGMSSESVRREALESQIAAYASLLNSPRTSDSGKRALFADLTTLREKLRLGQYYDGGFTGRGGMYEPAGSVHRGEYVIPKRDVNQSTGLPYADAFQRLTRGTPAPGGYANGGFVTGNDGRMVIDFSPMAVQQLVRALSVELSVSREVIGRAVSKSYASGTRAGDN